MIDLLTQLLAETDAERWRALVDANLQSIDDALMVALKDTAVQLLRSDVKRALAVSELMLDIADHNGNPHHRALALLAKANALSLGGLGEFHAALELYNEAGAIYHALGRPVDEANAQIGKVLTLANLGRYDEAIETGQWAAGILEENEEWLLLAKLTSNLGLVYHRRGAELRALAMFERAREAYNSLGETGEVLKAVARVENNRAIVLRDLGRFAESIHASEIAHELLERTGQPAEVARTEQNLAVTYYVLGRYNDTLSLLGKAQAFFLADGRLRDAFLVELFASNCLLQLRRFAEVLDKTRAARELFARWGARFEVAQTLLNEATAYAGLGSINEALVALAEARQIFLEEDNLVWLASTDIESAVVLQRIGRHAESLTLARTAMQVRHEQGLPVEEAQACLVAARAAISLQRHDEAASLVQAALEIGEKDDLPSLLYPCHHLLGMLAEARTDILGALSQVDEAIDQLERLRQQLMIEHRADFLDDKHAVYEDAVALCLELDRPGQGLEYAERAKSRALAEMLDGRLEIGIQARTSEDKPLVDELIRLKAERDVHYRRWESSKEIKVRGWSSLDGSQHEVQGQILAIEKRITALWHQLLVRNAGYASTAMLWQPHTEPIQPFLPSDSLLLEFFVARGRLIVFVVSNTETQTCRLPATPDEVQRLMHLLQMNLNAAAGSGPERVAGLTANARGLLQKLYAALLGPLATLPGRPLEQHAKLIIVPSGWLHYLPFHALHDGSDYLATRYEISYLPGASLLRHVAVAGGGHGRSLALGFSYGGALPDAPAEAANIAELLGGDAFLEEAATPDVLRDQGSQARVLHLATHAEFRPDNPLFSGLALSGTWLTTLDIFGLRLRASLVTLSACQTGRHVIGGGDEVLGLARAFLSAGAASLVLSLWAVEDRSTADFMRAFYGSLAQGFTKGAGLRHAQQQFIADASHAHPYYWAPFVLIGHTGSL